MKQLTQIERRQARIRKIRQRLARSADMTHETLPTTLESHHVIGQSQNIPVDLPLFVQNYPSDPAIKVSITRVYIIM